MSIRKKTIYHYLFVFAVIAINVGIRVYLNRLEALNLYRPVRYLGFTRSVIYIALFSYWAYWLEKRLTHRQVRIALTGICNLIIVWQVLRLVKFYVVLNPDIKRWIWYGYYFPMLFIPVLALIMSLTLGKSEHYKIPRRWGILFWISLLLFLMVATNDLHQLVFYFPTRPFSEMYYGYRIGYYLSASWMLGLSLASIFIMIRHCRIPGNKNMQTLILLLLPISLLLVYLILYALRIPWVGLYFGDLTMVMCICIALTCELCIYIGLIQSNRHYRYLAIASTMDIRITDPEFHSFLADPKVEEIPVEKLSEALEEPLIMEDHIRLSSHTIHGGYVFWKEDVAEIQNVIQKLNDAGGVLEDREMALRRENEAKAEVIRFQEKNRLYNMLMDELRPVIEEYIALIEKAEHVSGEEERMVIARIGLICAYLKRRSNLLFIDQMENEIEAQELYFCIRESLEAIGVLEIQSHCMFNDLKPMKYEEITSLYDALHSVLSACMDRLSVILVTVSEQEGKPVMLLRIQYEGELPEFNHSNIKVKQDEDEWIIMCHSESSAMGQRG